MTLDLFTASKVHSSSPGLLTSVQEIWDEAVSEAGTEGEDHDLGLGETSGQNEEATKSYEGVAAPVSHVTFGQNMKCRKCF